MNGIDEVLAVPHLQHIATGDQIGACDMQTFKEHSTKERLIVEGERVGVHSRAGHYNLTLEARWMVDLYKFWRPTAFKGDGHTAADRAIEHIRVRVKLAVPPVAWTPSAPYQRNPPIGWGAYAATSLGSL